MYTNGYALCEQEEKKVLEIFDRFKETFPDCILLERGEIFGIKEIFSYYMCYFIYVDGNLYIKFKCDSCKEVFDLGKSYEDKIAKTVEIFNAPKEEKSIIVSDRSQCAMERFEIMSVCKNILDKLDDKFDDLFFDEKIMSYAKGRLNQNEIYSVGDLKKYSLDEVYYKDILTKTWWNQLKIFLQSLEDNLKKIHEIMTACKPELNKLDGDYDDFTFDDKLAFKAKERLNRNGIFTIGDLKRYTLDAMYFKSVLIKNDWRNLKVFLQLLAEMDHF